MVFGQPQASLVWRTMETGGGDVSSPAATSQCHFALFFRTATIQATCRAAAAAVA
jgi:hypothetical protein